MRHDVAGIEISVDGNAWVGNTGHSRPVFHAWGRADFTRCGVVLGACVALPPRHAVKFARPCARCWPEIRRVMTLKGVLA